MGNLAVNHAAQKYPSGYLRRPLKNAAVTILILERVSPSLRGLLSRWLMEVQARVFVRNVNEVVRRHFGNGHCAA